MVVVSIYAEKYLSESESDTGQNNSTPIRQACARQKLKVSLEYM